MERIRLQVGSDLKAVIRGMGNAVRSRCPEYDNDGNNRLRLVRMRVARGTVECTYETFDMERSTKGDRAQVLLTGHQVFIRLGFLPLREVFR